MKKTGLFLTLLFAGWPVFVSASPYYSDLSKNVIFENFSSGTFALQVLQFKNSVDPYALVYGGMIETDAQIWRGDNIPTSNSAIYNGGSGIFLTQVTLDAMANASHWTTGFLSFSANYPGRTGPNTEYYYYQKAFILLGNLNEMPAYLTAGINTIPFGVFNGTGSWDTPLTEAYFSPAEAPQIGMGFYKNGWNGVITDYSDSVNHQNHLVYNLTYTKDAGQYGYTLGAGCLTGLTTNSTGGNNINRGTDTNAPALEMGKVFDLNGSVRIASLTLNAEYVTAQKSVQGDNTTPSAFTLMLNWAPHLPDQDITFGISRSVALHLKNVPVSFAGAAALPQVAGGFKHTWVASVSGPFWSNALSVGIDFESDETFAGQYTRTGTLDVTFYL